jgi:mannose-6-phosphate isomerase
MNMIETAKQWLRDDVCPLWLSEGVDWKHGAFEECLSLEGKAVEMPRRVMVQARQVFSFRLASELGCCDQSKAQQAIQLGIQSIIKNYSEPSGAFVHAVDMHGKVQNVKPDLYGQAFALFGLAQAYLLEKNLQYKMRAAELVSYLDASRRVEGGGFSELSDKDILYQSNPHMHLFEAAVAWMEIDSDPIWKNLASEILELCLEKFIDPVSGALAEHFNHGWSRILHDGKFMWEPGHQYEWAWLMGRYQKQTQRNLSRVREKLYSNAEAYGVNSATNAVVDEVWSDFTMKTRSSRFWPHTERVKAALQMGLEPSAAHDKAKYAKAADDSMEVLFKYFAVPHKGLWFDTWTENGEFKIQPAKASSLYHIIGAIYDYVKFRPLFP